MTLLVVTGIVMLGYFVRTILHVYVVETKIFHENWVFLREG